MFKEDKRWKRYYKAMDQQIKENNERYNKALVDGNTRECERQIKSFENWCRLNQPK